MKFHVSPVSVIPTVLLLATLGAAPAAESSAPAYGSVREAMAAYGKADPDTKLACFRFIVDKTAKMPGREVGEFAPSLGRMASDLHQEEELESFAARQIASKDPAWACVVSCAIAEWEAGRGAFEKAFSLTSAVAENPDRYTVSQRQSAVSCTAKILAQKKNAPEEAIDYLSALLDSAFPTNSAPAAFAALASQAADIHRTRLGNDAEAEALSRRILALGPLAPNWEFCKAAERVSAIRAGRGDASGAANVLLSALDRSVQVQGGSAQRLLDAGASSDQLAEGVRILRSQMVPIPVSPEEFRGRAERIQPEIITLLLALGRYEEAFAEARVGAFLASDPSYPGAVERVARVLKSLDGNLGRANAWLDFQSTSVVARAESSRPILLSLPAASDDIRIEAAKALEATPVPGDWNARLARSRYLLWLDRPVEATEMAASAFAVCPLQTAALQTCAAATTRPLLVATRDETAARATVEWLLSGQGNNPFPMIRKRLAYSPADEIPGE